MNGIFRCGTGLEKIFQEKRQEEGIVGRTGAGEDDEGLSVRFARAAPFDQSTEVSYEFGNAFPRYG